MNVHEIIDTLKMENEMMTFDPRTGESFASRFLNDFDEKCYDAHKDAISILQDLQDIADGKIKKYVDHDIVVYNRKWLYEHIQTEAEIIERASKLRVTYDANVEAMPVKLKITEEQLASAPVDPLMMQATIEQVQEFCRKRNLAIIDEGLLNSLLGRL